MEKEKACQIDRQINPMMILPKKHKRLIRERKQKEQAEQLKNTAEFIFELCLRLLVFWIGYTLVHFLLLGLQD